MALNIFQAVVEGNLALVKQALSSHPLNHDDWSDLYLLQLALKWKRREIIKLLLEEGCRVQNISETDFRNTSFYYAIEMQDVDIIRLLLRRGISFNCIDYKCGQPIELILQLCPIEILDEILTKFLDENINPIDSAGFSPFHIACHIGNVNLAEKFINLGNYINCCINNEAQSFPGFSPLHFAVESKSPNMVEFLLNHHADITIKNKDGKSPFHLACERKTESITDLLMMALFKRNINIVEDEGFSVLHNNLFLDHVVDYNISNTGSLFGPWFCWTPLHFAVAQQKSEFVEFILNHNVNVNAQDEARITPLHLACQYTQETFFKIVSDKAVLKTSDLTIRHNKQIEIIKMLLKHKIDVNATDICDKTPLFRVLENFKKVNLVSPLNEEIKINLIEARKELINLLLQSGADVCISDKEGLTVLHCLSETDIVFNEYDKIETAMIFLNKGANINAKTNSGKTPLFLSIRNLLLDVAEFFINHNADINCVCNTFSRFTPLHTFTYYAQYNARSVDFLNKLLAHGADFRATEIDRATPLHIAMEYHGLDLDIPEEEDKMAISLLEYGAEVDARDRNGQTPLHRACLNRYTNGTIVLLNYGADINLEDEFHNTPLTCACYRVQEENTKFFYTIRHHVHKLKVLGFHVSSTNKLRLEQLETLYAQIFFIPRIDDFLIQCENEIEKMKNIIIDKYTFLYDIIFKSPNYLVSHIKNETFLQILESDNFTKEFELYGYLLKLQYKRGKKRQILMEPAIYSLRNLSNCNLLVHECQTIFRHLSDSDLENLIRADIVDT